MDHSFRARVLSAATNLSVMDWRKIIARGFFRNACKFVVNELPEYSPISREAFRIALAEVATSLVQRATWFDLNASRLPAEEPQSEEGLILSTALRTRLQ